MIISGVGVGVQQTVQGRPSSNHCVTMCMKPVHAESIFAILWQIPFMSDDIGNVRYNRKCPVSSEKFGSDYVSIQRTPRK
jgi:hypothetical protein